MDEDDLAKLWECEVGPTGQVPPMKPETEA